jgi:hypothetical protein
MLRATKEGRSAAIAVGIARHWGATVDKDEHYCFAVALRFRSQFLVSYIMIATGCDLVLRLRASTIG